MNIRIKAIDKASSFDIIKIGSMACPIPYRKEASRMATSSFTNPPIEITADIIDCFIAAFQEADKEFMPQRHIEFKKGDPKDLDAYFKTRSK